MSSGSFLDVDRATGVCPGANHCTLQPAAYLLYFDQNIWLFGRKSFTLKDLRLPTDGLTNNAISQTEKQNGERKPDVKFRHFLHDCSLELDAAAIDYFFGLCTCFIDQKLTAKIKNINETCKLYLYTGNFVFNFWKDGTIRTPHCQQLWR